MDGDSKGEFGMNACYVDAEIWTRHNAERRKLRQDIASHKKGKNIAEFAAKYPSCRQTISI